jgi:hypothetical protein
MKLTLPRWAIWFAVGFLAWQAFWWWIGRPSHSTWFTEGIPVNAKVPWPNGSQMAPDGTLLPPWVGHGTREPVATCYPPTYLWGAKAEHLPAGMSGVLSEPVGNNGWRVLSFSIWVKGDSKRAARWYTKLIAVGTTEAELDERLGVEPPPVCESRRYESAPGRYEIAPGRPGASP